MKTDIISDELKQQILKESRKLLPRQIKWRRHFHEYPELSFEEVKTTAFLKKEIRKVGLKNIPIKMKTGLLAELKGKTGEKTVAVRTDIDALPVTELNSVSYKSKIQGLMHACGHDVHMAVILGTAVILNRLKNRLSGNVRFIFQPAEEYPPGGARPMIENGALENVSMIFGLHVDSTLPTGQISLRDGVTMAAVSNFDLIIHGQGGHAAKPQDTVDAITTAAEVIESIQKVVSREIDPIDPVVITFAKINGGSARNVICDKVFIEGTCRTLSQKAAKIIPRLIKRTAVNVCRARGARAEIVPIANYPVLANSPQVNKILERNYNNLFGKGKIKETALVLGSEDFACYLEMTKGAMFRLGVKNKKIKADKPWHSPYFLVDEQAIYYGTAVLTASIINSLAN